MTALRVLGIIIFVVSLGVCHHANGQTAQSEPETAAIDALYGEWIKATASKGADGYVSFFVADGAVLPPGVPAVEGKDAIRQWIQKELDEYTLKDGRFVPGSLKVANGWAIRRFSIAGKRVPKKGGEPVQVNNKYLDVLQKQADGSWKFVYRIWNSNE
jgi:uncharacterized protein (TIGR02246 family)